MTRTASSGGEPVAGIVLVGARVALATGSDEGVGGSPGSAAGDGEPGEGGGVVGGRGPAERAQARREDERQAAGRAPHPLAPAPRQHRNRDLSGRDRRRSPRGA